MKRFEVLVLVRQFLLGYRLQGPVQIVDTFNKVLRKALYCEISRRCDLSASLFLEVTEVCYRPLPFILQPCQ